MSLILPKGIQLKNPTYRTYKNGTSPTKTNMRMVGEIKSQAVRLEFIMKKKEGITALLFFKKGYF
jgi:hypothetical protein